MKEHPILFSAPMIRALLACTKSQTRRIANFIPRDQGLNLSFSGLDPCELVPGVWTLMSRGAGGAWNERTEPLRCPYGPVGNILWVRETYWAFGRWETRFSTKKGRDEWHFVDLTVETDRLYQLSDPTPEVVRGRRGITPAWWRRPPSFMPRRVSRISLEITGMRIERLQDINETDAAAEGVAEWARGALSPESQQADPSDQFRWLWGSIHGPDAWSLNSWVWVVEFKRVTTEKIDV